MEWSKEGIKTNDCYINHLRYADDVVLFADDAKGLKPMLQEISENSDVIGLRTNFSKAVHVQFSGLRHSH